MARWIPVDESLPGLEENVLVTADMGKYLEKYGEGGEGAFVTEGCLFSDNNGIRWMIQDMCQLFVVTAWMHLPKPYRRN